MVGSWCIFQLIIIIISFRRVTHSLKVTGTEEADRQAGRGTLGATCRLASVSVRIINLACNPWAASLIILVYVVHSGRLPHRHRESINLIKTKTEPINNTRFGVAHTLHRSPSTG